VVSRPGAIVGVADKPVVIEVAVDKLEVIKEVIEADKKVVVKPLVK